MDKAVTSPNQPHRNEDDCGMSMIRSQPQKPDHNLNATARQGPVGADWSKSCGDPPRSSATAKASHVLNVFVVAEPSRRPFGTLFRFVVRLPMRRVPDNVPEMFAFPQMCSCWPERMIFRLLGVLRRWGSDKLTFRTRSYTFSLSLGGLNEEVETSFPSELALGPKV